MIKYFETIKGRYVRKGSFLANVLTLMTGTTISQLILIAISPILTRLYTPQDFGIFAIYMAAAAFISVIATGRYELAIMLPKKDEEAVNVAALTIIVSFCVSCLTLLLVWLFNAPITRLLGVAGISAWLYMIPLSVFFLSIYNTLSYWSSRKKNYKRLAFTAVTQQSISAATNLGLGIGVPSINGLVFAAIAGQTAATVALLCPVWKEDKKMVRYINIASMFSFASNYRQFPMYNMPYSLIGTFGNRFIIFALSAFNYLQSAGFFNFSRSVMFSPITLISSSLGQVFFQEASVSIKTPRLEQIANKLMIKISELATPIFIFFAFWAPSIFSIVFGSKWEEAGYYARALTPVAFCFLFTSWPERIYEITQKQQISLLIQIISDSIISFITWALLYVGIKPLYCVLAFSLTSCIYHVVYLYTIFKIAEFPLQNMYTLAKKIAILGCLFGVIMLALNLTTLSPIYRFAAGCAALVLYYTFWLVKHLKIKDELKTYKMRNVVTEGFGRETVL